MVSMRDGRVAWYTSPGERRCGEGQSGLETWGGRSAVAFIRVIGPNGSVIERVELQVRYDEGRFPGLRRVVQSQR
jgi:hypothetical protein